MGNNKGFILGSTVWCGQVVENASLEIDRFAFMIILFESHSMLESLSGS